ncbi:MAG TPA: ECF transporter S component [Ktedonobacteraceae bacterium]|nr:ECF transporter S component [Ktedonobacteraceae bacterium]
MKNQSDESSLQDKFPTSGDSPSRNVWSLDARRIVTAGILVAITIILGVTSLGFIPVPNLTGSATIEHIPTILGSVLEGPVVGTITGLIFGLTSFLRSPVPIFKDPLISVLPRIFIGLTPWLVFIWLKRLNIDIAAFVAGVVGSLTNTFLVLGMLSLRTPTPFIPTLILVAPQAAVEALLAGVITVVVTRAIYIVRGGRTRAKETKAREDLPY